MTVESLSHWFHKFAELAGHDGAGAAPREELHRIEAALQPFLGLSLEAFAELLGKVKKPKAPPKPKKTDEEKAAEKAEKAEGKRIAKEAEKTRKADEVKRKKDEAAAAKRAHKEAESAAKLAKKASDAEAKRVAVEAEKARKAGEAQRKKDDAAEVKRRQKEADAEAKVAPLLQAAKLVADGLHALLGSFSGGGVSKPTVDAELAKLQPLSKSQALHVAKQLDSDAGLTDKSSKAQIVKALQTMVLRVWKTSDNVNH